jgi:phosphoglucosamine mutase
MNAVATTKKSLQELAGIVKKFPQILINIPDVDKAKIDNAELKDAVKKSENTLGDKGRVLLRSSGTEPLIRVMVEAETMKQAQEIAESLASVVKKTC